ncbi:DUF2782 domain-containing protein [Salinicola avicenniae]|uniref:DUF2782 domain-containing protein n=1 Tax=Salinicola avicenniae TaxID=2916836 RepID=UPI002072E951|nr:MULTISPECIES: DUF2782 domain-containing protein [unclassified Salinicola]
MSRRLLMTLMPPLVIAGLALSTLTPPALAQSTPQPEVTSQREGQRTIDEYRIDGHLYAIRIAPADGPAYFLYDDDGDGDFQRLDTDSVAVPDWVQND